MPGFTLKEAEGRSEAGRSTMLAEEAFSDGDDIYNGG
jgi:hypothetical protein